MLMGVRFQIEAEIRRKNALIRADFKCEVDESHKLFLRKGQPVNYTEPHHLIPLKYDKLFSKVT